MEKEKLSVRFFRLLPKSDLITYAAVLAVFAVVMILDETGNLSRQTRSYLVPVCYSVILAVSLNLVVGFLGELSLGHAGFMCVGAYAGCIFAVQMAEILPTVVRFPLAMLVGGLAAAVFGIIVGVPILRLNGDYLAIVTLAFGEIIRGVIANLDFTGGAQGLRTSSIQDATFPIAFAVVMITLFVVLNLKKSKVGRAIMAIRDNRIAAQSTGINITYYKLLVFVLAAFFAGVAGVFLGHSQPIVESTKFDFNYSINILVFVVLGGLGSVRGSIIAATLLTIIPIKLSFLEGGYKTLVYALLLIFVMLFNNSTKLASFRAKFNLKRFFKKHFGKKRAGEGAK